MPYQRTSQITEPGLVENKLPAVDKENNVQRQTAVSSPTAVAGDSLSAPNDLHQQTNGNLTRAGNTLLQLQNQFGNRTVQQLINPQQRLTVQPKLMLGDVDTPSEREADQIAAQMTGSGQVTSTPTSVNGPTLPVSPETERAISQAKGSGQPLPESTQTQMSQALGTDLSGVRVHTDGRADGLNQSLQAKAFTTGQDIFFRQGAYSPGSASGQQILAHELTHVVQQSSGENTTIQRLWAPSKKDENLLFWKGALNTKGHENELWYYDLQTKKYYFVMKKSAKENSRQAQFSGKRVAKNWDDWANLFGESFMEEIKVTPANLDLSHLDVSPSPPPVDKSEEWQEERIAYNKLKNFETEPSQFYEEQDKMNDVQVYLGQKKRPYNRDAFAAYLDKKKGNRKEMVEKWAKRALFQIDLPRYQASKFDEKQYKENFLILPNEVNRAINELEAEGVEEKATHFHMLKSLKQRQIFEALKGNKSLTDAERNAIWVYTSTGDWRVFNNELRLKEPSTRTQVFAKLLSSAMNKLPPYKGIAYRKIDLSRQATENKYVVGTTVTETAMTSTGTVLKDLLDDTNFNGDVIFVFKSRGGGKAIQFYSSLRRENEVLFPPGTDFFVKRVAYVHRPYTFSDVIGNRVPSSYTDQYIQGKYRGMVVYLDEAPGLVQSKYQSQKLSMEQPLSPEMRENLSGSFQDKTAYFQAQQTGLIEEKLSAKMREKIAKQRAQLDAKPVKEAGVIDEVGLVHLLETDEDAKPRWKESLLTQQSGKISLVLRNFLIKKGYKAIRLDGEKIQIDGKPKVWRKPFINKLASINWRNLFH